MKKIIFKTLLVSLFVVPLLSACNKQGNKTKEVTLAFKNAEETVEMASKPDLYDFVDFSLEKELLTFSLDEEIALIEDGHILSPIEMGTTNLVAKYNDLEKTCKLTIVDSRRIEGFPSLTTFETPSVYQSPYVNKWGYQAKKEGRDLFVYAFQKVPSDRTLNPNNMNNVMVSFFGNGITGFDYFMNEDNSSSISGDEAFNALISYQKLFVEKSGTTLKYYLKLSFKNDIPDSLLLQFYAKDTNDSNKSYGGADKYVLKNGTYYHTHIGEGWSVSEKLGMPHYSMYVTPSQYQAPVPERNGFNFAARKEGLYLHLYQIVDSIKTDYITDNDAKWHSATHVEMEIWNHGIGYGWNGTYFAGWTNGSYYINNNNGLKGFDLQVKTSASGAKIRIDYEFFLYFDNNLENPSDGPYAYIKPYFFDPSFGEARFNENDVVSFRDERFLHTIRGNSVGVHAQVNELDDPFTTTHATSRVNKFSSQGLRKQDLTLFIGDSFFEYDNWWVNFFTDFAGKNVFSSAIGGTRITQWLNWNDALIAPYAEEGKIDNIVIHLGYNDIGQNAAKVSAPRLEAFLEQLIEMIHTNYPSAHIYPMGVGQSYWFKSQNWEVSLALDALTNAYAADKSYVTFVDMDAVYNQYLTDNPSATLQSFFKDGTHPKNENYHYLVEALQAAGCTFTNL